VAGGVPRGERGSWLNRRRLLADITPLRELPAFRRLWAGTTLSSVGSAMTGFAVMLQVYDLTHSSLAVGAIGVAQMVPTLTVGLLCGPVADRDRPAQARAGHQHVPGPGVGGAHRSRRSPVLTCSGCSMPWSRCRPHSAPWTARPAARSCPPCCRPASLPPGWR